jgi:two-component system, chemotaxis family, CheB/CheR fusion protein
MGTRNADLNSLNADLHNLHVSIDTAIVVLSRDLRVRSFTAVAEKTFGLSGTDIGRPVDRIRHQLKRTGEAESVADGRLMC